MEIFTKITMIIPNYDILYDFLKYYHSHNFQGDELADLKRRTASNIKVYHNKQKNLAALYHLMDRSMSRFLPIRVYFQK